MFKEVVFFLLRRNALRCLQASHDPRRRPGRLQCRGGCEENSHSWAWSRSCHSCHGRAPVRPTPRFSTLRLFACGGVHSSHGRLSSSPSSAVHRLPLPIVAPSRAVREWSQGLVDVRKRLELSASSSPGTPVGVGWADEPLATCEFGHILLTLLSEGGFSPAFLERERTR